jgi:REP-associated tyrosine transposase
MRTVDTQNARTFYRRKLPHWHPEGATIFVTWRLKDSLPESALERIEETRKLLAREIAKHGETIDDRKVRHFKKLFALADDLLDRATDGPLWLWLKEAPVASMVEAALLSRYQNLYTLWSYVVMANHVHVFLQPKPDSSLSKSRSVPLGEITKPLKGYTSREANKLLERTGQGFRQIESFDHWSRNEDEFYRIISYIEIIRSRRVLCPSLRSGSGLPRESGSAAVGVRFVH